MKLLRRAATMLFILTFLPIQAFAQTLLVPVGSVVGLQLSDDTVTVAAYDDKLGSCAKNAGLRIGDEIVRIDEQNIHCTDDVRTALEANRQELNLTVRRGSRLCTVRLCPTATENGPRMGVYLRQGIAGIGTVTWYDPASGRFAALGHGVSKADGQLMQLAEGIAFPAEILSAVKGRCGHPGQLKGSADAATPGRMLLKNTPQGIFGVTDRGWQGKAIPAAEADQLHTGSASIRATVQGQEPKDYQVEILKVYSPDRNDGRNLLLKVTDQQLLETTGGIVQGMSGSPILQDGRLIGAVTHVLVNDPTMGYGIFIGNMLDAAA